MLPSKGSGREHSRPECVPLTPFGQPLSGKDSRRKTKAEHSNFGCPRSLTPNGEGQRHCNDKEHDGQSDETIAGLHFGNPLYRWIYQPIAR